MEIPHRFIAIEGNIGAGKTTLCHMLADRLGCSLVLEQFTDNPFLPSFYEHPERFAFPVELFFMTERHKQLQEHFGSPDLFRTLTVSDYVFFKTLLFARNNLNESEFRLFQRLYTVLNASFPNPDVLLFLHRPVSVLKDQIRLRGRSMERYISDDYLLSLQQAYLESFRNRTDFPVLVLDLGDANFKENDEVFQRILGILAKPYDNGVHFLSI